MVIIKENAFNEDGLFEMDNIVENFTVNEKRGVVVITNENKSYFNEYNAQFVELNDNFKQHIINVIDEMLPNNKGIKIDYCRVNVVTVGTNESDPFHTDIGHDAILLIYPNEDFIGGDLEWIDNNKINSLKPKRNMCALIVDNSPHRVIKVKEGVRYCIAVFCKTNRGEKKKSLM